MTVALELSSDSPEIDALLSTIQCAVGGRRAVYVSGPITTGPRFVGWFRQAGQKLMSSPEEYLRAFENSVLIENESDICRFAHAMRTRCSEPVIEPASLKMPSWTQPDFYKFWQLVIDRFVVRVIALDGWSFSLGCAVEIHHAMKLGLQIIDASGVEIPPSQARDMVLNAATEIEKCSDGLDQLQQIAARLRGWATSSADIK